jgi:FixJ family two-component response regulator
MTPEARRENRPTVTVIDDDVHMRRALAWLLESAGRVVETHASAEDFLASYDPERVGCLIVDLRLPGMSGMALLQELIARGSSLPVILLTGYGETSTAVQAFKLGAFDFIEKPFEVSLLDRVHKAIEYHQLVFRLHQQRAEETQKLNGLTSREREVMDLVVVGRPNKVIAQELGVSEKTVEVHRARVMHKLNAHSVADLVRLDISVRGIRLEDTSYTA